MPQQMQTYQPGQRVTVTQQIAQRQRTWTIAITGEVVRYEQRKTGSWFAHSKDDKLWLDRLVIRKDDGEIVVCNLDSYSHVEVHPAPEPVATATDEADEEAQDGPAAEDDAKESAEA